MWRANVGACWCGQSYFVDPKDGLARVVSSVGSSIGVWKVQTFPSPSLTKVSSSTSILIGLIGLRDPGFFTFVSSNRTANPIIWALSHPANCNPAAIALYAFDPETGGSSSLKPSFKAPAGN
jgi:hypothetical protein